MPNGPLFISRPYCSRARLCNTGLDASIRARYSGEMGGDPAGRSSNDRQWTTRSYCFSSFSKLEATKKQKGQTKSDQTSTRIAMSQNFLLVVTTCSYSIHYARIHLPKSPGYLRHVEPMPVTLSAAKGLARRTQRYFAALRMTGLDLAGGEELSRSCEPCLT